jgi:TfoX/Sxy family transcriptional regulator of competence genes
MAFDEELAERVLGALGARADIDPKTIERKAMFGGVSFMVRGAMCVGVLGEQIVARLDPDAADALLDDPGVRPMDFTGRPMRGWLYVNAAALASDAALATWVDRCVDFATKKTATKKTATKKTATKKTATKKTATKKTATKKTATR